MVEYFWDKPATVYLKKKKISINKMNMRFLFTFQKSNSHLDRINNLFSVSYSNSYSSSNWKTIWYCTYYQLLFCYTYDGGLGCVWRDHREFLSFIHLSTWSSVFFRLWSHRILSDEKIQGLGIANLCTFCYVHDFENTSSQPDGFHSFYCSNGLCSNRSRCIGNLYFSINFNTYLIFFSKK